MDLERARRRGIARSRLGLLTNPARALLWKLLLPYLETIADEFGMVRSAIRDHDFRFSETDARIDRAAQQPPQLVRRAMLQYDGLRKDLAANNHRLESLESALRDISAELESRARAPDPSERHEAMLAELRQWLHNLARDVETDHARLDAFGAGLHAMSAGYSPVGRDGLGIVSGPHGCFMVWPNDLIGRVVAGGGVWEPHVRDAIERHADPERVAIDAGAYIGLHTVHLSRFFRLVHAFEPQLEVFQVLCGNLALNACRNVRPVNSALSDHAGTARLATREHQEVPIPVHDGEVDYASIGNAAALAFEDVPDGSGPVPALTIDELRLGDVGFIKIDTQGADLNVLRGALNTIRRCRPAVTFEYEREMAAARGATLEAMLGFFDPLDYDVQVLHVTTPERQIDYIALPR